MAMKEYYLLTGWCSAAVIHRTSVMKCREDATTQLSTYPLRLLTLFCLADLFCYYVSDYDCNITINERQ